MLSVHAYSVLLQQQLLLLRVCVRVPRGTAVYTHSNMSCVGACVIDTMYPDIS